MENVYNLICNNINDFFDLLRKTNISKKELHEKLNILIEEEKIIYKPYFDKYYPLYKATLNVKEEGYAFAKVEGFDDDFYVPKDFLMGAYDEDEVLIFPYKKGYKLINAEVYKIIKRAHTFVIGILKCKKTKKGLRYYIVSNMRSFPVKVNVREEQVGNIEIDSIVKANVIYQGTALIGVNLERIGFKDDPGVEISQIALEYGFKLSFDAEVINELNDCSQNYNTEKEKYNKLTFEKDNWDKHQKFLNDSIAELQKSINSLENLVTITSTAKIELEAHLAVVKKMDSLAKRDFRGYLLANIIKYIDKKAKDYSEIVFGTRDLNVYIDGNALDISYCNKMFDNLSGGEKQRVDLILQFAIRDMLNVYLNSSANILVLDEITDFLDKTSCAAVMKLIEKELNTIESVFIVSHHADELGIPVDSEIKVIKNADGISQIQ